MHKTKVQNPPVERNIHISVAQTAIQAVLQTTSDMQTIDYFWTRKKYSWLTFTNIEIDIDTICPAKQYDLILDAYYIPSKVLT